MPLDGVDPERHVPPYDVPADGLDQPSGRPASKPKLEPERVEPAHTRHVIGHKARMLPP